MFFYGKNSLNSDKKSVIDVLKRNNLSQGYYQKELEKTSEHTQELNMQLLYQVALLDFI